MQELGGIPGFNIRETRGSIFLALTFLKQLQVTKTQALPILMVQFIQHLIKWYLDSSATSRQKSIVFLYQTIASRFAYWLLGILWL